MTYGQTVEIELGPGNINNHHFSLHSCLHLFSPDVIGPDNQKDGLGRLVSVTYQGDDEPCETDIAGRKKFFRRRGPIRAFFARFKLTAGDRLRLTRTGVDSYSVRPVRRLGWTA